MSAPVHVSQRPAGLPPVSQAERPAMRPSVRWALRALSLLAVAASVAYLALFARRNAAELPRLAWSPAATGAALAALLLYVANLANAAASWHLLLRSTGEPSRLPWALPVYLMSQVGKYLPGNVGHYVGRVALAARAGLRPPSVVLTLGLEAALSLLAAAVFAAVTWTPLRGLLARGGVLLLVLGGGLAALSGVAWFLGRRSGRDGSATLAVSARSRNLRWLAAFSLYSFGLVLQGTGATLVAHALFGVAWSSFPALAGLYAAAWAAGFLVPGAPAGLGVREAVLVSGLGPLFGPGVALALPIVLRLVTTAGDATGFALGAALRWRNPNLPLGAGE